jgi:hypothetical protein
MILNVLTDPNEFVLNAFKLGHFEVFLVGNCILNKLVFHIYDLLSIYKVHEVVLVHLQPLLFMFDLITLTNVVT